MIDFTDLTAAADFTSVFAPVMTVAGAVAALYVGLRVVKIVLGFVKRG